MDTGALGRLLMVLGAVLLAVGTLVAFGGRVPWLGRLPGDFSFGGAQWKVYIPLGTSVVLSIVLTVILNLLLRWLRK